MKVVDLSMPISEDMIVYPGDPRVSLERVSTSEDGGFNVTRICMGTHTGTHLDPPSTCTGGFRKVNEPLNTRINGRSWWSTAMNSA